MSELRTACMMMCGDVIVTRGGTDGLDMRRCEVGMLQIHGVEQYTVRLRRSCTGLTIVKGGEQVDMSRETLNIMARSKVEKDYDTFRWIISSHTELTKPTGAQGGNYEQANTKYNGAKRHEGKF